MAYFVIANSSIYWCAELDASGRFTGNFKYNYHGQAPLVGRRNQVNVMVGKVRRHLMGRYRFLGVMTDLPNPSQTQALYRRASRQYDFEEYLRGHNMAIYALNAEQLAQARAGQPAPPMSAAERRRQEYAEAERRRAEEIRLRDQRAIEEETEVPYNPSSIVRETVSFEGLDDIPSYRTDAQGFLPSYDREYKRPVIERTKRGPEIKAVGKQIVLAQENARTLFLVIKRFYESIPLNMLIARRDFDASEQGLWGPHTGKHFFILQGKVPIAGYEINTQQAVSTFLYIKTNIPNYTDILKRILEHMKTLTGGAPVIILQFRGEILKNKLLEIMPGTRITNFPSIKGAYKAEVIPRNIPSLNLTSLSTPDRWEDDA